MLGTLIQTRLAALAFTVAALAFAALILSPGAVQDASADEPVITYMYPEEGQTFAEPLQVIQFCFQDPIDVRDLPPGGEGDFMFNLKRPNGLSVGMRIVFQANGYGVAIYPGFIEGEEGVGEWTLTYMVRDRESLDPLTGTLSYEVGAGGEPIVTPTPQMCPANGGTPPGPTDAPDAESPQETPEPGLDEGDDDADVLLLSLLTIGAGGGAAVIGLAGYLLRRRIGFWLHRPSDEGGGEEHH